MKRISYLIAFVMLAFVMQACETNLDVEIDDVASVMQGNYSYVRTYMFANDSLVIPIKTIIPDDYVTISMEDETTVRISSSDSKSSLKCIDLKSVYGGVGFAVADQLSGGNRTVPIDSMHIKGEDFSGYYAATTKVVQMWYSVRMIDYNDELKELYGIMTESDWNTLYGYFAKILAVKYADKNFTDEELRALAKSNFDLIVSSVFTKVNIKDILKIK